MTEHSIFKLQEALLKIENYWKLLSYCTLQNVLSLKSRKLHCRACLHCNQSVAVICVVTQKVISCCSQQGITCRLHNPPNRLIPLLRTSALSVYT